MSGSHRPCPLTSPGSFWYGPIHPFVLLVWACQDNCRQHIDQTNGHKVCIRDAVRACGSEPPTMTYSIHVFRICMLLPGPWQRSVQNDESSKSCVAYSRGTESHRKHPRTWMREIVRPATTLPESPYTFEKVELAFSIRCVKADITNLHVPSGIIIPSTHHLSAPVRDSRTEDEGDKRGRKGAGSGDRSLYTYHHAVLPWHG